MPGEKKAARVNSLSLVRYRGNDYSVPTAYGHREVLVRGYVHEVVIASAADEIARHPRSYEREDFVFAELLFETFSQRYERGSIIVTSNLPFDEWTSVFASERLTGALLDRLTHHVHILEMNGDSYRLKHSKRHISDDQPPRDPA